jgi:hypothetical protein
MNQSQRPPLPWLRSPLLAALLLVIAPVSLSGASPPPGQIGPNPTLAQQVDPGASSREARQALGRGLVLFQQGTKAALEQALVEWQRALDFYQAVGDRAGEATTLGNVAVLYRSQNKLPEALAQINAAIELIEQLRGALQDDNLKTAYFATVQGYYQFKIDLLMQLHRQQPQQGYDGQALATADQGRARVLRELLTEANAQITKDIDPQGQPVRRGFLRLGDLFNLELGAELVVLSACETALGKTIRGEGMIPHVRRRPPGGHLPMEYQRPGHGGIYDPVLPGGFDRGPTPGRRLERHSARDVATGPKPLPLGRLYPTGGMALKG